MNILILKIISKNFQQKVSMTRHFRGINNHPFIRFSYLKLKNNIKSNVYERGPQPRSCFCLESIKELFRYDTFGNNESKLNFMKLLIMLGLLKIKRSLYSVATQKILIIEINIKIIFLLFPKLEM